MVITFVSVNPQISGGPFVRYGLSMANLNLTAFPYNSTVYGTWTAGVIYRVRLTGLVVGTNYWYQVVDQSATPTFSFETWSDDTNFDTNGGAIGQQGTGPPGSTEAFIMSIVGSLQTQENAHFMLHAGNTARANGNDTIWDVYGNIIQPVSTVMPFMVTPGFDDVNRLTFADDAYLNRFTMPTGPESKYYYTFRVGQFQVIVLNTEEDYRVGSTQYNWLESKLIAANTIRNLSPWIVVSMARPMYSAGASAQADMLQHELIRESFEKLFHKYGVDIVFQAGIFSYERSFPVHNKVVGYVGSGTEADPYVNPVTQYFSVGTASSRTDDVWLSPVPSFTSVKLRSNGVCEFHAFHANKTFSLHFNELFEKDVVWARKDETALCPNGCSGNGFCSPIFYKCVCNDHFYGHDCHDFSIQDHLVDLFATDWRWMNVAPSDPMWMNETYDDSNWTVAPAPFGYGSRQNYFSLNFPTNLGGNGQGDFYFRKQFVPQFPAVGNWTFDISLYVSSDGGSDIYLNGIRILNDINANHPLRYWNDIVSVDPSLVNWGQPNTIAAQLRNNLGDGFFDMRLSMKRTCGPMWTGIDCDVSPVMTTVLITSGDVTTSPLTSSPISIGELTSRGVTSGLSLTSGAVRATTGQRETAVSSSDTDKKGLPTGGIIAIVVVAIAVVAVGAVVAFFIVRRNKRQKDTNLIDPNEAFQMDSKQ